MDTKNKAFCFKYYFVLSTTPEKKDVTISSENLSPGTTFLTFSLKKL